MRVAALATLLAGVAACAPAAAEDGLQLAGLVDLRYVDAHATPSFLNGGLGRLRFDSEHDGLVLGRASLASRVRLGDELTLHAVLDSYGDHDTHRLGLSEAFVAWRPFPVGPVRWQVRVGAFHLPASLEHRGPGWSPEYTLTPSAINTWFGEELRTIGAEIELKWLGASRGYAGDLALVGAAYAWNDPAGEVVADRGFGLSDRPSLLGGGLGRPTTALYQEIDHAPGYYTGFAWRHAGWLEVRALRYDNRGDPGALLGEDFAWRTRFWAFGVRAEPGAHLSILAQYLSGDTFAGPDAAGEDQYQLGYHAAYVLGSYAWQRERITVRFDDFHTHQRTGFYGPPTNDDGHALTLAWRHAIGERWLLSAEWLRVASRFPPRLLIGLAAAATETQVQAAVRYRFTWSR